MSEDLEILGGHIIDICILIDSICMRNEYIYTYTVYIYIHIYIHQPTNQGPSLRAETTTIQDSLPARQRFNAVSIGNWVTAGPTKVAIFSPN